jgi:hypothetical protein
MRGSPPRRLRPDQPGTGQAQAHAQAAGRATCCLLFLVSRQSLWSVGQAEQWKVANRAEFRRRPCRLRAHPCPTPTGTFCTTRASVHTHRAFKSHPLVRESLVMSQAGTATGSQAGSQAGASSSGSSSSNIPVRQVSITAHRCSVAAGLPAAVRTTDRCFVAQECNIPGKTRWTLWRTTFEIDEKYQPIKAVGEGARAGRALGLLLGREGCWSGARADMGCAAATPSRMGLSVACCWPSEGPRRRHGPRGRNSSSRGPGEGLRAGIYHEALETSFRAPERGGGQEPAPGGSTAQDAVCAGPQPRGATREWQGS